MPLSIETHQYYEGPEWSCVYMYKGSNITVFGKASSFSSSDSFLAAVTWRLVEEMDKIDG